MKKPPPAHQVHVVVVPKPVRGLYVERGQAGVAGAAGEGWAGGSPSGGEVGVDVGVVVDAGAEGGAAGEADGVAARERGHVAGGQAFGGEAGDEGGEVSERGGDLGVRGGLAGGRCVSPAEGNFPCGPS